ncbi:MAG: S26 family signal peptidase [Planctomycetota bacterium]|jgi:signal peptidase I|nr:S26 family signal peptidase [Planctomycetota bacterium]
MGKQRKQTGQTTPPTSSRPGGEVGAKAQPAWRSGLDFIVMLGGAVLIALAIKAYAFDVYLIPSGSMETALHGRPDGGDRIFCSKLHFLFRPIRRWEVAVFLFPFEQARQKARSPRELEAIQEYNDQNFVKRIIGLPGETLAIHRGDVWVRRIDSRADFKRLDKPDSVQRGMWQNVYEEDFSDLSKTELEKSWRISGHLTRPRKNEPLLLSPGDGAIRLDFRPLVPSRAKKGEMEELPGIPDRYILEQPVQFRCRGATADGGICGRLFVKTVKTQSMLARCPVCGYLNDETSAVFYHRRSGLYQNFAGKHLYDILSGADSPYVPQGEEVNPRGIDYHIVPDLRVLADLTLETENSLFAITLREDDRRVQARFNGDGRVEIRQNDQPSRPEARAVADLRSGQNHRVEFYLADGVARLFIDSEEKCLLELPIRNERRSQPGNLPKSSGVSLSAEGGDLRINRLGIDRDIFYYSGWEGRDGEKFPAMNSLGEVQVDADSFFPMGDHCPSSYDARTWGPVPLASLRGPALFTWWPPERLGLIASP